MTFKYSYEQMLDRAFESMPQVEKEDIRFEIPVIKGSLQGNKTIVTNLPQIASHFGRDVNHLFKFFLRELATTGDMKAGGCIFIGKFNSRILNEKVNKYFKEFVTCDQCKKPDTTLLKESGLTFKRCEACGAKSSVRTLK